MNQATISQVISEYEGFLELLDDAYWEANQISHKDFIYDVIGVFSKELSELNKLSIQVHHYTYEFITEGIARISNKVLELDQAKESLIPRTKTLKDLSEVLSNIIVILESQTDGLGTE